MTLQNNKLIELHRARLYALEEKQAQFGFNAPVEIDVEIDSIRATITALETVSDLARAAPVISPDRRDTSQQMHYMIATVQSTVAEVASVKVFVRDELREMDLRLYRIIKIGVGLGVCLFLLLGALLILRLLSL